MYARRIQRIFSCLLYTSTVFYQIAEIALLIRVDRLIGDEYDALCGTGQDLRLSFDAEENIAVRIFDRHIRINDRCILGVILGLSLIHI